MKYKLRESFLFPKTKLNEMMEKRPDIEIPEVDNLAYTLSEIGLNQIGC